jgi:hypothetical protein
LSGTIPYPKPIDKNKKQKNKKQKNKKKQRAYMRKRKRAISWTSL